MNLEEIGEFKFIEYLKKIGMTFSIRVNKDIIYYFK